MKHLLKISFLCLACWLISCNNRTKESLFVEKYQLGRYDTIYVVSCISCGGCMQDFLGFNMVDSKNRILIFDENCNGSPHIKELKRYTHISISQNKLESVFGEFGNMIIVYRMGKDYKSVKYPE